MVMLNTLERTAGISWAGVCRVVEAEWLQDTHGLPYLRAVLADCSEAVTVYGWPSRYQGPDALQAGECLGVDLLCRQGRDAVMVDLLCAQRLIDTNVSSLQLLPITWAGEADQPLRLHRLVYDNILIGEVSEFLDAVFADEDLARAFMTLPASHDHHHAVPGGLALHSLEVAESIARNGIHLTREEHELAIAAGLLHDIGKTRTFGPRRGAPYGLHRHEDYTLELLASPLRTLEATWPDGAAALRYLLTWHPNRNQGRPLMPAALLVHSADTFSSAQDLYWRLFEGTPAHQRVVHHDGPGLKTVFWRPVLPAFE